MFYAMQGSNLTAEQSHEVNLLQQETAKPDIEIDNLLNVCSADNATAIEYLNKRIEKLDNRKYDVLNRINEIKKDTENVISLFSSIEIENGPYVLTHGSIDEKKNVCQFLFNGVLFTNVTEHSQVLNYPLHLTNLKVLRVIGNLFKKTALSCKAQQGCSLYKTLI